VARRHNALNISEPLDGSVRQVRDRPAMVLGAQRFVDACLATVRDPLLTGVGPIGGIDQLADNTDLLSDPSAGRHLREIESDE
jgi:hypothetical protein